jgi:hypothetical protein
LPETPSALVSADSFGSFYKASEQDYTDRVSCFALNSSQQRDICFSSLASQKNEPAICDRVSTTQDRERCYVMLAQTNANATLCGDLKIFSDDCYIAVAGENGNYSLCQKLNDRSLGTNCTAAATQGQKKMTAAQSSAQAVANGKTCKVDSDCSVKGSAGQYCVGNGFAAPAGESFSPEYVCYKSLPCGCDNGYCGFRKNETYYNCISGAEDVMLQKYIASLTNQTANSTNKTQ